MKPQRYAAKRSHRENQLISTITSDRDGAARRGTSNSASQQAMYDRDRHTQVKTYTDHGNGHGLRATGSSYSKVSNLIVGSWMYEWDLFFYLLQFFGFFFIIYYVLIEGKLDVRLLN